MCTSTGPLGLPGHPSIPLSLSPQTAAPSHAPPRHHIPMSPTYPYVGDINVTTEASQPPQLSLPP